MQPVHRAAGACTPAPPFLEAPCELSIDAAFSFLARGRDAEFWMTSVQEILADDGPFERRRRLPGEASIQFPVGGNRLIGNLPHVPESSIKLKMRRQVQRL